MRNLLLLLCCKTCPLRIDVSGVWPLDDVRHDVSAAAAAAAAASLSWRRWQQDERTMARPDNDSRQMNAASSLYVPTPTALQQIPLTQSSVMLPTICTAFLSL